MIENIIIVKRLYKDYTSKYLKKIILAVFFAILVATSTSAIAYLLDPAIEKIFIEKDQTLIYLIPLAIVISFSVKGLSLYISKVLMINVAEEVKADVQKDMLKALIASDTNYIDKSHSGQFISKLNNDVMMLTHLISNAALSLFKDTLTLIGLLSVMFIQNWKLSLIAIFMIPLAGFTARILGKRISKVAVEFMQKSEIFTKRLVEVFKNHKLIKIFQAEKIENEKSYESLNDLKSKTIKTQVVFNRNTPVMETLTGIMIAILLIYSGTLIKNDELEINNFFSFLAAMMLAYQPVRSLAGLNISISQGIAAAKRVLPIVDIKNEIDENLTFPNLIFKNGEINFSKVDFNYNIKTDKSALNKVNLNIPGGKTTALVGPSGSGKSTILNLIPRFYDPQNGEIKIDDQHIKKVNLESLRKHISFVSQETTLFDDTIKNNILYAKPDASNAELEKAAHDSFSSEFINELPHKFETKIGENGLRLSGGQKQRISIARAMLKNSSIILLDEATSSLDSETESKIQNAIQFLTRNKTTVIIAHRLSTILNSNLIYVIENGKVVGEGNHQSLLVNSKTYKNFYERQLKKD
jgi:subfamily B ATP-binding cassette protein MsbA